MSYARGEFLRRIGCPSCAVGLGLLLLAVSCGGGRAPRDDGRCYVRELYCEGCESWSDEGYCGTEVACEDYCSVMSDRPTTVYCEWQSEEELCSGSIPEVEAPTQVCAVMRTIACGSSSGTTDAYCDFDCSHRPGSNEYDAELDCLTEYSSEQGVGLSCDEALADLAGGGGDTEPPACAASEDDSACTACTKAGCCDSFVACGQVAACPNLLSCLAACTDTTCENACIDEHPDGVDLLGAYLDCVGAECTSDCSG